MTNPAAKFNLYLPTSFYLSDNYEKSWIKLQNTITDIFFRVNARQIGLYYLAETPTGQIWSKDTTPQLPRQASRQVYNFGPIVAGTTLSIPHNIIGANPLTFTHIYGTAIIAVTVSIPLPYVDVNNVTNQVGLNINGTNIQIIVGATSPNIASGIIVLEYLKN